MNVLTGSGRVALPRVDVIVPCYRYGHVLFNCVASIIAQSGVQVRVVIVDDASPDHTAQVAAGLAAADSRIEVIRHEHNRGHIATFNHGLEHLDAEFVTLVSADDLLTEGSLARAVAVMRRHPEVGFVYGRVRHFTQRWHTPCQVPAGTTIWAGDRWLQQRCQRAVNVITSPEVVVRTATHRQVGGYEPTLPHTADLHLWLRLAGVADVAFLRGRTQAGYRVHQNSLQRTVHAGAAVDVGERLAMFQHLAHHAWRDRADVDQLLATAMTAIAQEAAWRCRRAREHHHDDVAEQFRSIAATAAATVSAAGDLDLRTQPRPWPQATLAALGRRGYQGVTRLRREVLGT